MIRKLENTKYEEQTLYVIDGSYRHPGNQSISKTMWVWACVSQVSDPSLAQINSRHRCLLLYYLWYTRVGDNWVPITRQMDWHTGSICCLHALKRACNNIDASSKCNVPGLKSQKQRDCLTIPLMLLAKHPHTRQNITLSKTYRYKECSRNIWRPLPLDITLGWGNWKKWKHRV